MRSSRAVQILRYGSKPSYGVYRAARSSIAKRYCSVCDSQLGQQPSTAHSTTNPPIPPADHRQLAIDQQLFTTSIYSPGSPLFLPNGTWIFNKLTAFLRAQYIAFGFQEVVSPTIYKKSLWEKSGHWDNYAEDMFSVTGRGATGETEGRQIGEDEEFGLKPMNCPGHCILFSSQKHSFRDLPIRFADFSPLHRNEISGALSGLTRVRRFHQDDAHIFCRPSQVAEEITKTLDFVYLAYNTFNLGPYRLALSTRPKDHYIGDLEEWDRAEADLRQALDGSGQVWSINEGDGAFYGPKIDIILKDSDGKEHQTATIQLDFQLPKRFELEYIAPAPELEQKGETTDDPDLLSVSGPVRPVMIHRAILGSVERFMALLIEHYNGRYPFWLNPRQVKVITVRDDPEIVAYAQAAVNELQSLEPGYGTKDGKPRAINTPIFKIDIDTSARSVKKKIREAKMERYGIIVLVGAKNVEGGRYVTVDFGAMAQSEAVKRTLDHALLRPDVQDLIEGPGVEGKEFDGVLREEHMKALEVSPKLLKEVMVELDMAYQ
jgi:threonyl-tRNA synthetase